MSLRNEATLQLDLESLLKVHDWRYYYSDDHVAFNRGKESMNKINTIRDQLDPVIFRYVWNNHCPTGMQI